jgi:hypothetical protein
MATRTHRTDEQFQALCRKEAVERKMLRGITFACCQLVRSQHERDTVWDRITREDFEIIAKRADNSWGYLGCSTHSDRMVYIYNLNA